MEINKAMNEPRGCMYPICICYGEHTPYLCDGDPCTWPKCECAAKPPEDAFAKCSVETPKCR